MIYFEVQLISLAKRKTNCSIEQQNCQHHGKYDRLLVLKMVFNFLNNQRNKKMNDEVSSIWDNFTKKVPLINSVRNSNISSVIF